MAEPDSNESRASALNAQGYELAEAGRWEEAIPFYQDALRFNPRDVLALTNMGNALQSLGRLPEALAYQEKALAVDPDSALAWANKAVILSGLDRRAEAIRCYERSLEIDPSNKTTWFNKGVALFLVGRPGDAIKCLDHILENLDSRMKNALGAKAEILKSEGRPQEAAKCLQRMQQIEAEGDPFSFASAAASVDLFGRTVDTRRVLRGFEAVIRQRTGLSQISADFLPSGKTFEPMSLEYSESRGYRVFLPVYALLGPDAKDIETDVAAAIQDHARRGGIRLVPPPIPGTEARIDYKLDFDTSANHYDALANDGGCLVAFYREKRGDTAVLVRHVPPIGVVRYRFLHKADYRQLLKDAAENCSAFLDLSYLEGADMDEGTLRTFLRENDLYGWGSKEF